MNPAIPSEDVVRALLDPSQPSHDPSVALLQVALSGFGFNFYDARNQARANDLLVRERVSNLLADAAARIRTLEVRYRERSIPAATREEPFPPADALRRAKALHELTARLDAACSEIVTLEVPGADPIWSRVRDELPTLHRLFAFDVGLATAATALYERADALTAEAAELDGALDAFATDFEVLRKALVERRALLSGSGPALPHS
ncbi:MAG: hypothetical protein HKL92_09115 [Candidatus Eremiobacteraeota bacterium]|nr:hypothetical protein [Candidatus Eremiobacteraeota bacterium]NNM93489.1 hypothetical protein [Candidatus Eremiobacteraeota bacterium]